LRRDGSKPDNMKQLLPEPFKKDDIESLYNLLKDAVSNGINRSFERRYIVINSLKNRNYIYLDRLGQFFVEYEERFLTEQ